MKNNLLLLLLIISYFGFGQTDSVSNRYYKINWVEHNLNTRKSAIWKKSLLPIGLAVTSLSLNEITTKTKLQDQILAPLNGYSNHIDDYIQYVPLGILFSADAFKMKAEHSVWNQTKYLFFSEVITGSIVLSLKYGLKIERPDKSAFTAFPSGHTSFAFVGSQVLYNEFKNTNKLLAYSGFLFSIPTGALRVVNNRHWVPDVLMGAGIAMLVTNLVYHFEPLKNWTPKLFKKQKDVSLQFHPNFSDQYVGGNLKLNL